MNKPYPTDFTALDLKLIEDSVYNLENTIPKKSKCIVTQKQLIQPLEYLTALSKKPFDEFSHVYRLLLKIHSKLQTINQ